MKNPLHRLILLLLFGFTSYASAEPEFRKLNSYRLKIGDQLQLSVFLQPDLTKTLTIDREGKVSVTMIEKALKLHGLTRAEAAEKIRSAYTDGYLKYPQVDLKITEYSQEVVLVSGQVASPGAVPIPLHGNFDLFSALNEAGWVTASANTDAIKLVTAEGESATISLAEVQGAKGKRLMRPGDQIIVSKSRFSGMSVSIEGKVEQPGLVAVPKSGRLDLLTAIVRSGGPSMDADLSKIELISADGSKSSIVTYDSIMKGNAGKILLKGGDRVLLRQSPFVGLGVILEGAVLKRGFMPFPLSGKFTLKSALSRAGFSDLANKKKVDVTRGANTTRYDTLKLKTEVLLQPGDTIKVVEKWF